MVCLLLLPFVEVRGADNWDGRNVYYVAIGTYASLDEAREAFNSMPDVFSDAQVYQAVYKGETVYIMCTACLDSMAKAKVVARDTNAFVGYFLAWVWRHRGLARCVYMLQDEDGERQPFMPR